MFVCIAYSSTSLQLLISTPCLSKCWVLCTKTSITACDSKVPFAARMTCLVQLSASDKPAHTSFIVQVLGCDVLKSGIFSVLPWVTMAISANVGGWIADTLVAKGWSVTTVRKLMQTIGFLGPAFCLSQLANISTIQGAVTCMMGAQGFDAFSQSGLYSNHQDIGPQYAGVLLGLSNTAGVLAGVLGSLATGYILANGTWTDVWRVAIVLYLVGTVIWNLFSTGERIFFD